MVRPASEETSQPGRTGKWIDTAEGWARANVIYEKTNRPPKAGSLREALLLTVWLRRQEIEGERQRMIAQGLADIAAGTGAESHVAECFKSLNQALFPFLKNQQSEKDKKMLETIKKETRGVITFKAQDINPLKNAARKRVMMDEETRTAIQQGKFRRKISP